MTNKGAAVLLAGEARGGAEATGAAECDSPVAVLVRVALALSSSVSVRHRLQLQLLDVDASTADVETLVVGTE